MVVARTAPDPVFEAMMRRAIEAAKKSTELIEPTRVLLQQTQVLTTKAPKSPWD
jgi:hypothetical protein